MRTAYFLHHVPQGHYPDGIMVPFATLEEAERQAAWEIMHGHDPGAFQGVFKSEYDPGPASGWVYTTNGRPLGPLSPHLDHEKRERVHTTSQLAKRARQLSPVLLSEQQRAHEQHILDVHEAIRTGSVFKAAVPGNAYVWQTGGTATATPAALAAATAKTVVYVLAAAANQPAITEIGVSFDGVTSTAVPVLVELISSTAGTAGTPRAALAAAKQVRGWPAQTSQTTVADTYSAEPGTSLVNRKWFVTPFGGLWVMQFPLGREPTGLVTAATDAKAWGIRVTAPAIVNCHAYIELEE